MRRILAVLVALTMLFSAAAAQRYESTLGYALELPDGWGPYNSETHEAVLEGADREKIDRLTEQGLAGEGTETALTVMAMAGIEVHVSERADAFATVTIIEGDETLDALLLKVDQMCRDLVEASVPDAVSGSAAFGENRFAAVVYSLGGTMYATYMYPAAGRVYTISFVGASEADVGEILSGAELPGFGGGAPEPTR